MSGEVRFEKGAEDGFDVVAHDDAVIDEKLKQRKEHLAVLLGALPVEDLLHCREQRWHLMHTQKLNVRLDVCRERRRE
jgi:hypothetical protein